MGVIVVVVIVFFFFPSICATSMADRGILPEASAGEFHQDLVRSGGRHGDVVAVDDPGCEAGVLDQGGLLGRGDGGHVVVFLDSIKVICQTRNRAIATVL